MVGLLGLAQLGPILVLSGLLFANAILPQPRVWAIFALAAAQAGLIALQRPSMDALLPRFREYDGGDVAGGALASVDV